MNLSGPRERDERVALHLLQLLSDKHGSEKGWCSVGLRAHREAPDLPSRSPRDATELDWGHSVLVAVFCRFARVFGREKV